MVKERQRQSPSVRRRKKASGKIKQPPVVRAAPPPCSVSLWHPLPVLLALQAVSFQSPNVEQ